MALAGRPLSPSRPLAPSFCKMPVTIKRLQRVLEQVKIYEVSDEIQR